MEKQKILDWLDRLIAIREAEIETQFFDPEKRYNGFMACVTHENNEIQLSGSIRGICDVCGFEMRERDLIALPGSKEISFEYGGYHFLEIRRGEAHV